MPAARVNGISMYYEQHGTGEPLLLINGLGADITLLAPIMAWFERSFRVVAFDNRGAGRTDKPDAPYTIELMAQDTAALMDVLSLERANVLGISMGGRIALEVALSCPSRVGRLVLVSTSAAGRGKVTMSWPMRLLLPLRWPGCCAASTRSPAMPPLCLSAAAPGFGQLRRHRPAGRHPRACPDPARPAG
jgi:pimeloyl-ACP methyl ester carboxylesterase